MGLNIIFFIVGFIFATILTSLFYTKKNTTLNAELITLKANSSTIDKLQEIIRKDFVQLANETIKNEQEDLRKQNRESLEEKIKPLEKELGEFKEKVEKFNLSGVENTTKIIEQISNLEKNNKVISQEAKNLTDALTKNQNIKGSYGEDLLDVVLQSCGMREGIHYSKQFITKSENLKDNTVHTVRPDIVLNLPDDRHLIIDSKVTLTSYLQFSEDNSKLSEFKAEVKKRIVDLANKNYQNAGNLMQPDFVLMYMPIENSVNVLYEDADLIQQAYKSNVIIVGTSSLLATIRLVNQLFAQQKQAECINKIVNAGTNLYETFVQFCEDLIEVQSKMNDVSSKLTTTINRFKRGNKNKPSLFSQVEELKTYGINSNKNIPTQFLECIEEDENLSINEPESV